MVHFDPKNCQSQAENLGYNTEFCVNCTLGWLNFAQKSFALSGLFCTKWFCAKCTTGLAVLVRSIEWNLFLNEPIYLFIWQRIFSLLKWYPYQLNGRVESISLLKIMWCYREYSSYSLVRVTSIEFWRTKIRVSYWSIPPPLKITSLRIESPNLPQEKF